jgi:hypothetical protein
VIISLRTDGRSSAETRRDETDAGSSWLRVMRLERSSMSRFASSLLTTDYASPLLGGRRSCTLLAPSEAPGCHQRRKASSGREAVGSG